VGEVVFSNYQQLIVFLLVEEYVFFQFLPVPLELLHVLLFLHQSPLKVVEFGLGFSLPLHHLGGEFTDLLILLADLTDKFFIFIFKFGILQL
jgi:hypothetical protein